MNFRIPLGSQMPMIDFFIRSWNSYTISMYKKKNNNNNNKNGDDLINLVVPTSKYKYTRPGVGQFSAPVPPHL